MRRPCAEFLGEAQRHRIHQVGATGLDRLADRLRALVDGLAQVRERRQQLVPGADRRHHPQRGRDDVVAALAEVDVVVGMDRKLRGLRGSVRDDLVGVHVAGGAGTGLVAVDRELLRMRAGGDRGSGVDDGVGLRTVEQAEVPVDQRSRGLDQRQRLDEGRRHRSTGDVEIVDGALGLRAPQCVRGHLQLAHAVVLDAETTGFPAGHGLLLHGMAGA